MQAVGARDAPFVDGKQVGADPVVAGHDLYRQLGDRPARLLDGATRHDGLAAGRRGACRPDHRRGGRCELHIGDPEC